MTDYHLVNVWTDPEAGPGGFNPMVSSMLWLPDGFSIGHPVPAFVYVHDWGGYPYDSLAVTLGPEFASRGYVFLSLALRRRGMEGQLAAMPDNDMRDIKLALDYLHTNGCRKLFLLGDGIGGVSAQRYAARKHDRRVSGMAWANPVVSPAGSLRAAIGDDAYFTAVKTAGVATRQGAGMDTRIDLFPENRPAITQNAMAFLSWWGPQADTRVEQYLAESSLPLLVSSATGELPAELSTVLENRAATVCTTHGSSELAEQCVNWVEETLGVSVLPEPPLELVHTHSAEHELFGLLWTPADGNPVTTVTLLMHGLTSSPLSPLFQQMAPVLAQTGTAVLAVESQRSGWAGHETSVLENDVHDLDAWVSFLTDRGYEKIILAGASIGSISVGRYQSVRQHPNVVAIAHLMPTADCPDWFRQAAGEASYSAAVKQAEVAIANGNGAMELIDVDVRQPPPGKFGARFRWTQRADCWLSWWGPDADSRNSVHIANAKVPLLLLSGTDDSYNDPARFTELKAAAVNAPSVAEIWYPDIDHGLAGVEEQVARDLFAWMQRIGVVA